ncbi:hypothetical protein AMTR_s00046p00104620, partial [Amborella trichopoda]
MWSRGPGVELNPLSGVLILPSSTERSLSLHNPHYANSGERCSDVGEVQSEDAFTSEKSVETIS